MKIFDVAIIGGGIIGACIFSKMQLSGVKSILIEKGEDVCLGASKANSGIVHAGYDCEVNTNKAFHNIRGNKMFGAMQKRLGEAFVKTGSLVVGDENSKEMLQTLYKRGKANGVKSMKLIGRKKLLALEPNLSENIKYGLYAKTAAIISPYNTTIALCEEAIINGGVLKLNYEIANIGVGEYFEITNGKEPIKAKFIINCAGAQANEINDLIGDEKLDIKLAKGEYILLDKTEGGLVRRPIFPLPTKAGKGILVLPTEAGNILCGPTAVDIDEFETSVSSSGIDYIKKATTTMVNGLNFRKAIKLYAGVRVKIGGDFVIRFSNKIDNYYLVAGICSPGLTSAPSIAEYVLEELKTKGLQTQKIKAVRRKPYVNINRLSTAQLNKLIKKDPTYGNIICRCEGISEGEIKDVLKGPIRPLTIEGIKRRLRTTMGRCQGSFCTPNLIKLVAQYYHIPENQVVVRGKTPLVVSDIKEGGIYDNWCVGYRRRLCRYGSGT